MKKEKASVHDLFEYHFAKKMVEDIPEILIRLDNTFKTLYTYIAYKDIANVLDAIMEAQFYLQLHYVAYKEVYDKKGRISEKK